MALDPSARYPGQVDTTTDPTGYPLGAAQDITVPGDGTGTPWQKDLVNDIWGFFQAMLAAVSATATGTPDKVGASQYLSAIQSLTTTAINAVSLQAAYLRSVALAQTAPHIDVTTDSFQVGGTVDPMLFRVVNSTETSTAKKLAVLFETSLNTLAVSGITTLAAALNGTNINASGNVAVTGATSTGTLSVGGAAVTSGSFSVTPNAVTGTGASTGDVTGGQASYGPRFGTRVPFSMVYEIDCTGYATSGYTQNFTIPIASNFASIYDVQAVALGTTAGGPVEVTCYADTATNDLLVTFALASVPAALGISISGHYVVI